MIEEKQRQLDEIYRPMNEELYNNIKKQYQELAKVKTDSEQIEEMAKVIDDIESNAYIECYDKAFADADKIAEYLCNAGYRKQSEVIDEFAKRLIDAFPEATPNHQSPCLYYDEYRYIIEELAEEMKGGAE